VAALAGCEQLKSPQRISELEDRIAKLSGEVETLKTGSAAKPGDHADSGSDHAAGEGSEGSAAGSAAEGSGSEAAAGEHAAGEGSAAPSEAHEHPEDTADAGAGDAMTADERAFAQLQDVVDKTVGPTKHGEPGASGASHWAYEGKTGPPTWGTLDPAWSACLAGKAQSPIDIEPRAGSAKPIAFHYQPSAATIIDNGHSLQVNLAPGNTIEIDGRNYRLLQFHFHAPSEHTIAGEHYPLEAHLVHQDSDGKLVVIGVLYDVGAESRPLARLWSKWPRKVGAEDKLGKPFDPSELLPETRTVFRYTGSLTTPPCMEGVQWNVMRRVPSDSKAALDGFARHYPHNVRDVQPLNGRKIE
jgi:carbonic anhydrase